MNEHQFNELQQTIAQGFDRLALAITTAVIMSGWTPDDPDLPRNSRSMRAVHTARNILHDAASTVEANYLKP